MTDLEAGLLQPDSTLTQLVLAHARGEEGAFDRLLAKVYDDLRRMARGRLRHRLGDDLDSRDLVHETYLRLAAQTQAGWRNGGHFRAAFAQAMRHILVDAARRRLSAKRGSGQADETLPEALLGDERQAENLLLIDQALHQLRRLDERLCRVVECRFFVGMTEPETGEALGMSSRTVHRDWLRARGWLRQFLDGSWQAMEPLTPSVTPS